MLVWQTLSPLSCLFILIIMYIYLKISEMPDAYWCGCWVPAQYPTLTILTRFLVGILGAHGHSLLQHLTNVCTSVPRLLVEFVRLEKCGVILATKRTITS